MRVSIFIFLIILISCEKVVEIEFNSIGNQLVVEGYIQQSYPAYVFLTKSESFFNSVDSNTLNNIAVNDAQVYIQRNDGLIHYLTYVDQVLLDSLGISDTVNVPINALYVDLMYQEDDFSQIGYSYKLFVLWNGDTINSSTFIPPQWPIDSVWVKRKDSLESNYKCYIWARINDPDTLGNFAAIHYKRDVGWKPMDPLFIPCAIPFRPDNVVNGESFEAFFARSGRANGDDGVFLPFYGDRLEDGVFVRKDIVLLRICHINQQTYKFWRSAERMQNGAGNPFVEPMNLSSNINGGLGIWAGYGVSYYYIPIVSDTVIYDTYNQVNVFDIF